MKGKKKEGTQEENCVFDAADEGLAAETLDHFTEDESSAVVEEGHVSEVAVLGRGPLYLGHLGGNGCVKLSKVEKLGKVIYLVTPTAYLARGRDRAWRERERFGYEKGDSV
jgi:hypothetical protein